MEGLTRNDLVNLLESRNIRFPKRATKPQLWKLLHPESDKRKFFWDQLKKDTLPRRKDDTTQRTTCNGVVKELVSRHRNDKKLVSPTRMEQEARTIMRNSEDVMIPHLSQQAFTKIQLRRNESRKKNKTLNRTENLHLFAKPRSVSPNVSSHSKVQRVASSSKVSSHHGGKMTLLAKVQSLDHRPLNVKTKPKKKNIDLEADVDIEFEADQREIEAYIDEMYEAELKAFELSDRTDEDTEAFVHHVIAEVDRIIRDANTGENAHRMQFPSKKYLMELAYDLMQENGYSTTDADKVVEEWNETIKNTQLMQQEARLKEYTALSPAEESFYDSALSMARTAKNLDEFVRYLKRLIFDYTQTTSRSISLDKTLLALEYEAYHPVSREDVERALAQV